MFTQQVENETNKKILKAPSQIFLTLLNLTTKVFNVFSATFFFIKERKTF